MTRDADMPPLAKRPRDELEAMHASAERALLAAQALSAAGETVVSALMPGADSIEAWAHYPEHDIRDRQHRVQFYYHAHPEEHRGNGEHGHFHVFAYPATPGTTTAQGGGHGCSHAPEDALGRRPCHLIGISMDALSRPVALFTTNRWVTGEDWRNADEVTAMIRSFDLAPESPYRHTRDWLAGMIGLFRPRIERLIAERDVGIAAWRAARGGDVFEDRDLYRVSVCEIDLLQEVVDLEEALEISPDANPGSAD
ncbi:DUF6969 family protein [Paracoccus salsus]|uniref:DUF6969 family protein n=1 Tax=Paracoccus salsus TaxID=2911061 RepID=UPI001F488F19|nr:hypothetical protein [Paracoccus salsus]MCF3972614.1 hypothetical protein [Paracoccus salsus]